MVRNGVQGILAINPRDFFGVHLHLYTGRNQLSNSTYLVCL